MTRASPLWPAFNGGEISPLLQGRVDLERYGATCQRLRNMLALVQGPATKRPGTRFVAEVPDSTKGFRLIPFEFSRTQAYMLGFGDGLAWVFRDGAPVLEADTAKAVTGVAVGATTTISFGSAHKLKVGDHVHVTGITGTVGAVLNGRLHKITAVPLATQLTVAVDSTGLAWTAAGTVTRVFALKTPYAHTELDEISYAQSADVLYLAHPSHHPRKLLRFDHDDWTLTEARGFQLGRSIAVTGFTNANPAQITTAEPHGLKFDDRILLTRMKSVREAAGLVCRVKTVVSSTQFTLNDPSGTQVNSTAWREFIATATGEQVLQKITLEEFQPVEPENRDPHVRLMVLPQGSDSGEDPGQTVNVFATRPIFTAAHVGQRLRLRELPEVSHTTWKAASDLNTNPDQDKNGTPVAGDLVQYEGNVYELVEKLYGAATKTGLTPPTHVVPGELQSDHRWLWEYAHSGSGVLEIVKLEDEHQVKAIVRRRIPRSFVSQVMKFSQNAAAIVRGATTSVTTFSAHGYSDGDEVFIYDTAGMVELNERTYFVNQTGALTFDLYEDRALTTPLDSSGFSADGTFGTARIVPVDEVADAKFAASHRYAFEAWSAARGYPRAVTFFDDRLWWGSSTLSPQTMWASRIGLYEDHGVTGDDASALEFTLNAADMNAIEWLEAGDELLIGTEGGIFVGRGADTGKALGPENILRTFPVYPNGVRRATPALRVDGVLLFVQRSGKRLRELVFEDTTKSYRAPDLAEAAEHLTRPRIRGLAFQAEPWRVIWAYMEDGSLAACTYDRQEEVVAWAPQSLGGTAPAVESAAVIPLDDEDQLWCVVARTIDGATRRYVEYLERPWEEGQALADPKYLDCALTYAGAATSTVTGLWFLEGETVDVFADGVQRDAEVVADGAITISGAAAAVIHVGLPMGAGGATLATSRPEAGARDGTAQGKVKRQHNMVLRLYQTGAGLEYGSDLDETLDALPMTEGQDPEGAALTLLDGDTVELALEGYDRTGRVAVKHATPLPCTVVAIMPHGQTEDRL